MKKQVFLWSLIFLILDIITKIYVDKSLLVAQKIPVIDGFFSITKVYNTGASFSLLSGYNILLILVTIIMFLVIYKMMKRFPICKKNILMFSLLYGGIIGNLLNRVIYGYVIDFLAFKIYSYSFPIFNLADVFIVSGVFLLAIAIWKKEDENGFSSGK